MIINEISELKDLVVSLQVLVDTGMDILVDIDSVTIRHQNKISIGNVKKDFKIKLTSDEIENLWANSKRIKVIK